MTAALTLDLMDLSEVGARPDRLAGEILRQVRAQLGELPRPVPLRAIAQALGIESIEDRETESFEGALVALPDKSRGTVVLRKGLSRGRRNFTLGHELGHFVSPYHHAPADGFYCNSRGLAERRSGKIAWKDRSPFERMEVEANEFSSFLNVPRDEFRADLKRQSHPYVGDVASLAASYAVSKEMMAQIYVTEVSALIGIITSHKGQVARCILPSNFPYLGLSKKQPLPMQSLTHAFVRGKEIGATSKLQQVRADTWLDRSSTKVHVFEQVLVQRDGWAMTMLLIEDAEDEDQDEAVERAWYKPQFGYRR